MFAPPKWGKPGLLTQLIMTRSNLHNHNCVCSNTLSQRGYIWQYYYVGFLRDLYWDNYISMLNKNLRGQPFVSGGQIVTYIVVFYFIIAPCMLLLLLVFYYCSLYFIIAPCILLHLFCLISNQSISNQGSDFSIENKRKFKQL